MSKLQGQSCCFALIKTQMPMRTQPAFQLLPIERIVLPVRSRDELPPILAGKKATGRPGMDLWRILVLGTVRLGLDVVEDARDFAHDPSELKLCNGSCPPTLLRAAQTIGKPEAELAVALNQLLQRDARRQGSEPLAVGQFKLQARPGRVMDFAGAGGRCRIVLGFHISEITVHISDRANSVRRHPRMD